MSATSCARIVTALERPGRDPGDEPGPMTRATSSQPGEESRMRGRVRAMVAGVGIMLVTASGAWAEGKVTITREESKPKDVEIKAGDEVRFINSAGQTVHVWFAGNDAVRFYVPPGSGGAKVKFDKPGTYEYTVHVTAGKTHAHTGSVVVK